MKLNEVGDEFQNAKGHSAEEKHKFAQQRVSSIHHHMHVAKQKLEKFRDRFVNYRFSKITPDEIAKGFSSFVMGNDGGKWAVYHSLTPQEIPIIAALWGKIETMQPLLKKAEQAVTRYKLEVKKANGTYVSQADINMYERNIQKDIGAALLTALGSSYSTTLGSTRTKKNGTSRVSIQMFDTNKPGAGEIDKKTRIQIKDIAKRFLDSIGFTITRVSMSTDERPGCVGWIEAKMKTEDLVKRYRKTGG